MRRWVVTKARAKGLALSVIGVTILALALATWKPLQAKAPPIGVLTLTDAVIDFGRRGHKVTIRADLDNVGTSQSVNDFTIQLVIVDNRTGETIQNVPMAPTVVR